MRFQGCAPNQTQVWSFCFYFKGKQKQKNKPSAKSHFPVSAIAPQVTPWLRPDSSSHSAPLPSPASQRAAGSMSLEAQIQGQGRGELGAARDVLVLPRPPAMAPGTHLGSH